MGERLGEVSSQSFEQVPFMQVFQNGEPAPEALHWCDSLLTSLQEHLREENGLASSSIKMDGQT